MEPTKFFLTNGRNEMPNWIQIASTVSAITASFTGIVVAVLAIVSYRESKRFEFEADRPFIIPRLTIGDVSSERWLFLEIRNVGDTPAKNVRINFLSIGQWHWVTNPDYPFLSESGISAIGPGETISFFLGVIRTGNPISDIEKREVFGEVVFDHPIKDELIRDKFRTSLTENRYKAGL
jgi:hypothetical protein